MDVRRFLQAKITGLSARLSRLARVDNAFVGLRPQDMPYAPSGEHFRAANARLARVEQRIRTRFAQLEKDRGRSAPRVRSGTTSASSARSMAA